MATPYYELVPWSDKSVVVLKGYLNKSNQPVVTLVSAPPKSRLAAFCRRRLREIATPYNGITGPYTLTVDARIPERVGSLRSEDALKYLRARLVSKNTGVTQQAVLALKKMRDLESVGRALRKH